MKLGDMHKMAVETAMQAYLRSREGVESNLQRVKERYEELSKAGVGTFICMHLPEPNVEEAQKHHLNVIVTSHTASDSLGTNILADKHEQRGVAIIPCSGYVRVARI